MSSKLERFVHKRRVTWGETDVAGSVDLSTVTRYCMEALEEWFLDRLGSDWHQLHVEQKVGTPFVRAELEFHSPVRPRDALMISVKVEKVGRSSVVFHVIGTAGQGERRCWEGHFTCVFLDPQTMQSIPVPQAYRSAIEQDAALAGS